LSALMALFQYYKTASPLDSLHHTVCVCRCVSVCTFQKLVIISNAELGVYLMAVLGDSVHINI